MRRNRTARTCEACGTPFTVPAHRANTARFCKRECALHAPKRLSEPRPRDASKRETRTCGNCGVLFETWVARRQECCSYDCSMVLYRARATDRFWSKVDKNGPTVRPELGPCWVWVGTRYTNGYGQAAARGRAERIAHRVSWALTFGSVPDDLWVLHRCDNPPCVRPDHLYLGTGTDNAHDMWDRNRHPRTARLTESDVAQIRAAAARGVSRQELAHRYGVQYMTITDVIWRRTWKHVT